MKKIIPLFALVFLTLFGVSQTLGAFGDPFLSTQVGTGVTNGDILTTDGTNSSWVTVASLISSSSGTVSTSTNETQGFLPYWTTTSGTPAKLGQVATTTLTATAPISLSNVISVIGATPSVLTCAVASGSLAGCLSSADWTTFNSKLSSYDAWTHPAVGQSATTSLMILNGNASTTILSASNSIILGGVATPAYSLGKLAFDTDSDSLVFFNSDSNLTLNIGQESWIQVRNSSGATIGNGQAVYINGNHAGSGLPTIALAQANSFVTAPSVGVTTESIANNATGFVTQLGVVHSTSTVAYATGDVLYLSATTPGHLTATAPVFPNFRVRVGIVTKSSATGSILVGVGTRESPVGTSGSLSYWGSLGTLGSVATTTITLPSYMSYTGTLGSLVGGISGTFAINSLPIANGGTATTTFYNGGVTFYNSTLGTLSQGTTQSDFFYDVANKRLGLGTTTPQATLSVSGGDILLDQTKSLKFMRNTNYVQYNLITTAVNGGGFNINLGQSTSFIQDFNFINSIGTAMTIKATGLTGIGSTTPWGLLSVNPTALGSGVPEFVIGSSTATHLLVNGAGNVGIASTSPSNLFSVGQALSGFFINTLGRIFGRDTTTGYEGVISPTRSFGGTVSTTTSWTATSTKASYVPMPFAGTLRSVICNATSTQAFLGIRPFINNTSLAPAYFVASNTPGIVKFTGSNTFTVGDRVGFTAGTTTSDVNATGVTCTFSATETF